MYPQTRRQSRDAPDSFRLPKSEKYKNSPLVSYSIPPNGIVTNLRLKKSSGSKSVDDAVMKSTGQWKYKPRDPVCGTIDTEMSVNIDWR
jgi:TonB family protein